MGPDDDLLVYLMAISMALGTLGTFMGGEQIQKKAANFLRIAGIIAIFQVVNNLKDLADIIKTFQTGQ